MGPAKPSTEEISSDFSGAGKVFERIGGERDEPFAGVADRDGAKQAIITIRMLPYWLV